MIFSHHAKSQANLGRYPSQGLGKGMRAKHTCGAKPDWVVTVTVVCGFTPLSAIILLLDLSPTFHLTARRCPAPASSTCSPPQRLLSPHCTGRPVRASRQGAGLPRSGRDHPQEHRLGGISNPAPPWVGRGPTGWSTPAKANSDLMLAECTPGIQHHICPQALGLHHIPSDKDNGKSKLAQKSLFPK